MNCAGWNVGQIGQVEEHWKLKPKILNSSSSLDTLSLSRKKYYSCSIYNICWHKIIIKINNFVCTDIKYLITLKINPSNAVKDYIGDI